MTKVFVHGVPESPAVWDRVREAFPDSTALRLPGFGSPRPPALTDKDAYARWLAEELRAIGGPIDLVGHDWGGHLTLRVATAFPDIPLRSWVSDVTYGWHPDYVWHDVAQAAATPEGVEMLRQIEAAESGSGATLGDLMQARGMTPEYGAEVDRQHNATMSAAMLDLYRSALPNFGKDWGQAAQAPTQAPGLVLIPAGDAYAQPDLDREMAARLGAQVATLDGLSHYWMLQEPEAGIKALQHFWGSI